MSDQEDHDDTPNSGLATSRSKRDKSKKVTNRLAALAALKATRDSGKKHLSEVEEFKVSYLVESIYKRQTKLFIPYAVF